MMTWSVRSRGECSLFRLVGQEKGITDTCVTGRLKNHVGMKEPERKETEMSPTPSRRIHSQSFKVCGDQ